MIVIPVIEIDLNNITMQGRLIKTTKHCSPPNAKVGDLVVAVDPDECLKYKANIYSIDNETERVMLEMDWDSEEEYINDY